MMHLAARGADDDTSWVARAVHTVVDTTSRTEQYTDRENVNHVPNLVECDLREQPGGLHPESVLLRRTQDDALR